MQRSLLALSVVLALGELPAQTPTPATATDWAKTLAKAHTSRRVMLRRAAARKVAAAGDAAVPAVRQFEKRSGRNALNLEFVTSYARTKAGGAPTLSLLREWAEDRDFYWRAQALEALANRGLPQFRPLFLASLSDPSHLVRIQAGRGLSRLEGEGDRDRVLALLRDPDPRARVRIAVSLVEAGDDRGLPTLVTALAQDGQFLDYPWGQLGARTAFQTLRKLAKEDFGFKVGTPPAANRAAIDKFTEFARRRLGEAWVDPVAVFEDGTGPYLGGIAIRSCRNGDLFLRFTEDRRVVADLEARTTVRVPEAAWDELWRKVPPAANGVRGKVICDYLRIMCENPAIDEKFAPDAMSKKSRLWLEAWAAAIEKTGREDLAKRLRSRLEQFPSGR